MDQFFSLDVQGPLRVLALASAYGSEDELTPATDTDSLCLPPTRPPVLPLHHLQPWVMPIPKRPALSTGTPCLESDPAAHAGGGGSTGECQAAGTMQSLRRHRQAGEQSSSGEDVQGSCSGESGPDPGGSLLSGDRHHGVCADSLGPPPPAKPEPRGWGYRHLLGQSRRRAPRRPGATRHKGSFRLTRL